MGEIQYFTDSKNRFAPYYDFGGVPPQPFQLEWMQEVTKPQQMDKVRLCPEADQPHPVYVQPAPADPNPGNNMPGAAHYHWGPYGRAMRYFDFQTGQAKHLAGSYTFNGYCLRAYDKSDPGNSPRPASWSGDDTVLAKGGQAGDLEKLWVPPFRNTAAIPIISDGAWPTAWPKETDAMVTSLYDPANNNGAVSLGNNWNRILVARHGMAINVGFFDGHVSKVDLPDVWTLPWHGPLTGPKKWDLAAAGVNLITIKSQMRALYKG
jgi:prepilin-type processing-associated H-X9-DG protein